MEAAVQSGELHGRNIGGDMNWLEKITEEMKDIAVEDIAHPLSVRTESEKIIGVASDKAKRCYGLSMLYDRKSMEQMMEAKYSKTREQQNNWTNMSIGNAQKRELIMSIFWGMLREEFDLWATNDTVGIREEWAVVLAPHDCESGPPEFIRKLFGG
jgi:hypothetical protein